MNRRFALSAAAAVFALASFAQADAQEDPPPKPEAGVVIELVGPVEPLGADAEGSGEPREAAPAESPEVSEPNPDLTSAPLATPEDGAVGAETQPAVIGTPWRRDTAPALSDRVRLDADSLDRVYRGARITRIGRTLTASGAGLFLLTSIAAAASGVECGWADDSCEEFGAAMSGVALGASAMWAGTVTWSSGTLVGANALRRGGVPVSNGAGIAAVVASATWFPIAWIAAPIQHHENRRAWDRHVESPPDVSLGIVPAVAGGQFGATLSLRF